MTAAAMPACMAEEGYRMLSPCYKCTDRSLGCHSTCSLYLQFRAYHDAENKALRDDKAVGSVRGECFERYKEKERRTPNRLIRRK